MRRARIVAGVLLVLGGSAAVGVWMTRDRGRALGIDGVVTLDGKPVAGAMIVIDPLQPMGPQDGSVVTDPEGRFTIAAAPWEWCRVVAVSNERYAVALLGPDRRGSLELVLQPPGALEVGVTGEGGAALTALTVHLIEPIDDRHSAERLLYASSAGTQQPDPGTPLELLRPNTFHAADLVPGHYFAWVRAAGFVETFFPLVISADQTSRVQFVLPRLVHTIGRVTDARGEGLPDAGLELTPIFARPVDPALAVMAALRDEGFALLRDFPPPVTTGTDARGAFVVELGPGRYKVAIVRGDQQFVGADFTAPSPALRVIARPAPK